ncbi:MAG TPA: RagB/SusD family nutrient uptake outer membrane protein [Ferruginibacter sp.]|jgi:hypothetical protein|nr:RagB/SusD family nutrient uptake outer membrane protein [Chitinophagaceae bacterium]MBP7718141.1 RagB/SusD family nutrient uptake outer membrane protein [Ferruginibacter sp.]MBP8611357.1 RagB/SusD family nutrient uptake outer membrane protein [Ferruginibacter sp.]MBP8765121.1 RagB/SusD family nutrient uptake outer membrane protein [Ferruginibacter sp.]MBP9605697.1 RagB/SusD family nutrient uptake outer membrane protein [Ferruginibacter sp.]
MKKLMIIFCGVALLASCKKDQLELYPYNQIETSQAFNTEADVTLALNGLYSGLRGMYAGDVANIMGDVLADNIIINQQGRLTLKTFGQWLYTGESTYSSFFNNGYSVVRRANAILENIDNFAAGTFKDNTKGEALAARAMIYFDMARIFAKTYTNAAATDSVLPYVIATDPTILPAKEPVTVFYDKLVADLEAAKILVSTSTTTNTKFTKRAVSGLLSKIYLYRGEWQKCVTASNDALGSATEVTSLANFIKIWQDNSEDGVFFKIKNTKTDNLNSQGVNYYQTVGGQRKSEYVVEYNLKQLFTIDDIRASAYIESSAYNGVLYNHIIKYNGRTNGDPAGVVDYKAIRGAEVLLNRAEAYFKLNNETSALADLNTLKSNRYFSYTPVTLSGTALINEIYLEHRLEMAFEGDRFFDLKRRNIPVQRDGSFGERADGTGTPYVTLTIPLGSKLYQLPYPVDEINYNTNFTQNPGY